VLNQVLHHGLALVRLSIQLFGVLEFLLDLLLPCLLSLFSLAGLVLPELLDSLKLLVEGPMVRLRMLLNFFLCLGWFLLRLRLLFLILFLLLDRLPNCLIFGEQSLVELILFLIDRSRGVFWFL